MCIVHVYIVQCMYINCTYTHVHVHVYYTVVCTVCIMCVSDPRCEKMAIFFK